MDVYSNTSNAIQFSIFQSLYFLDVNIIPSTMKYLDSLLNLSLSTLLTIWGSQIPPFD
jgi:hypothetical protein